MIKKKKFLLIFFFFSSILIFFYYYNFQKKSVSENIIDTKTEEISNSNKNTIIDVEYMSTDAKGNKYTINAKRGEIDLSNTDVIFLSDVLAVVELNNSNIIRITSNFSKYNILNHDTIFSRDVIINYLDNKITSEYLDFSFIKNIMIITKNVIYSNYENILYADVLEMDLITKDIKIFMHDKQKQVKIRSK